METVEADIVSFESDLDDLLAAARSVESCDYILNNTDGYYNMNLNALDKANDTLKDLRQKFMARYGSARISRPVGNIQEV